MNKNFKSHFSALLLICCLLLQPLTWAHQEDQDHSYISNSIWPTNVFMEITCLPHAGMFFNIMSLLGGLEVYERGLASGLEVCYGLDGIYGPYYEPSMGTNWWKYYFEPLSLGFREDGPSMMTQDGNARVRFSYLATHKLSRKRAHLLLTQYVHVKPHIQSVVDDFVKCHFESNTVIGIHYRGTDKKTEAPRVSYKRFVDSVKQVIAKMNPRQFKLFVATDEQAFLDYINQVFPGKVVYFPNMIRSVNGDPVHLDSQTPYKTGEDAIIECLGLSRCHAIVRTPSHLSHVASFFNPDIPVTLVK